MLSLDERELGDLGDVREDAKAGDKAERDAADAQRRLALGRCDELLDRLTDAYLEGALDRELFERRKAKLLSDRQGHIDALNNPPEQGRTLQLLEKLELGNMALQKAEIGNSEKTRETVSLVMSSFIAKGKELGFKLLFPFDLLIK